YLFATEASHAPYLLQFGWPDLTDDVASWGNERDLEILATHCKWEMDYQEQELGKRLVAESLMIETLPTGLQFITWRSAPIGDPDAPKLEVEREGGDDRSPGYLPATQFAGYASIRNGCELVLFEIRGLGTQW